MKCGSSAEYEVDFGAGAFHLDAADRVTENRSGSSVAATIFRNVRLGSALESTMRARISVPSSSTTPRARPSRTSMCATGAEVRISTPSFLPRSRQRLGDRAHAAHHVSVESLQFVLAAAQQVKQQANGCAWLVRSTMLAINVVGEKHRLHLFGLVVVIEKFAQASGEKGNQLRNLRRSKFRGIVCPPETDRSSRCMASGVDLRRRLHERTAAGSAPAF